jgi:hypothetical protein
MSATIHEKIAKLLALAGNNPSTHEAAAAAAKAQELLFAHNLDLDAVLKETSKARESGYIDRRVTLVATAKADLEWQSRIVFDVASCNFAKGIILGGTNQMVLIGEKHNLDVVEYLIAYLFREIDRLSEDYYLQPKLALFGDEPLPKAGVRASFCRGAAEIIGSRLRAQFYASTRASSQSQALVVSKENALSTAVAQRYPRLGAARMSAPVDYNAMNAGRKAGQRVALNTGVNAGSGTGQFQIGAGR